MKHSELRHQPRHVNPRIQAGKAVASSTIAALAVENTVWMRPSLVGA